MKTKFKYSIIIPCYNEERTVFEVVDEVCKQFAESDVIVVDDESTDKSFNEISKVNHNNLKALKHKKNIGKGAAMRTGLKNIEKSIIDSNLGVNPQTDGNNILLKFPDLTSERRKEIVKIISENTEKYKISIRSIRKKYIDEIKNLEKEKSISLDETKEFQNIVQKLTDESTTKLDSIQKSKEKEILNF